MDFGQLSEELSGANKCDTWSQDWKVQDEHKAAMWVPTWKNDWSPGSRNWNSFLEEA